MKKTYIISATRFSLFKSLSVIVTVFSLLSFSSCDSPSFSPEVGSCVDLFFDIEGVSVESNIVRYDTTSYYESILYPRTLYAVVGDTVSFGSLTSHTLSSSSAEIRSVTYLVTCVKQKELTIIAKNAKPERTFGCIFDSPGIYNLAIYPTWNCSHPRLSNGFSWAINIRIAVVAGVAELPEHISPIGVNTFNMRLTRILHVEP